nr:hypothetical protein [Tanacetum cinerariifolium]
MGGEFEASEPSSTRTISSYSLASYLRTARMIVLAKPAMSPGHSATVAEAITLSDLAFCNRYRFSYETSSPSPSLTLPVKKRYRCIFELILDTDSQGDELGYKDTKEAREDKSSNVDDERERTLGEPLGTGYEPLIRRELAVGEDQVTSTFEVGQCSRFVPEQQGAERVSASRQPILTTWVDPTYGILYTKILAYVQPVALVRIPLSPEWSSGSLTVLPSSLVVPLPKASPVDTSRYRFRSLEREYERATVTFSAIWMPILALEAWSDQTDAQRAALWHAIYDIQRENHHLRRQIADERCERLELTDRVARMERRQETISSYSLASLNSTTPLSPDHPLTQDSPTPTATRALFHYRTAHMIVLAKPAMSPGHLATVAEAITLSDLAF